MFLNDVTKEGASVFLRAVADALKAYAPERKKQVSARKKKSEEQPPAVFLLKRTYEYPDGWDEYRNGESVAPQLSAVKPFFLRKDYPGRANETGFIDFLEAKAEKIAWWFKNGDEGKDSFGLKFFNTAEREDKTFYPDWIVKFKDGRIGVFDTKGGMTAEHPEGREIGLRNKIAAMNTAAGSEVFWGGLVVRENNLWYWHDGKKYAYPPGKISSGWKQLQL